ncbi:unnamed protein product [Paramecium primaurelia]|uniref:Uncharacterized protein n=1 Tax=Paramecium primaurelia TaxID=5886 RepID=A0A8S1KE48_PARPR|nr:unnamed protein product [Paramecium primaurelia]
MKKIEKKEYKQQNFDIIMTLKAIDFQEIAQSLQNVQLQQSSQENAIQQENLLDQGEKDDELREIQYFENSVEEQKMKGIIIIMRIFKIIRINQMNELMKKIMKMNNNDF